MNIIKNTVFFCLSIINLYSCQKTNKESSFQTNEIINMKNIEQILEKQIKNGANQYMGEAGVVIPSQFEEEDIEAEVNIIDNILKTSGYKFPTNDEFKEKIENVFGRKIGTNSTNKYLYVNYLDKCNHEYSNYHNNGTDYFGTYIIKNDNFISDFLFIPELVDYQKVYLKSVGIENNMITEKKDSEGNSILIEKWGDLEKHPDKAYNLIQLRQKNIQTITARNKYLFNDSKADFVWLKFNDTAFLESLVLTFGYTKDKELLKWVIESIKLEINPRENNAEEFGKLLWHKDCSGQLKIHTETFELMHENNKKELPKYEDDLLEYIFSLNDEKQKISTELTFSEKAKIIAYCLHFMSKESDRITNYMGTFAKFSDQDDSFSKEFEKNNFYNIPNFKEEWKEAKEEGDGIGLDAQYIPSENTTEVITSLHLHDRPDFSSFSRKFSVKGEIEYLNKTSGWDYVRINETVGYIPIEKIQKEEKKKNSFLAEDEPLPKKKKGFLGGLFS